jgi:hypothetical protein
LPSYTYRQLNRDYAYWTERRRIGVQKGGHVCGLLSHLTENGVTHNLLFDCGLGTLEAIADFCPDEFWDQPLAVFITHGHIDHHAELMVLSEIYCTRRGDPSLRSGQARRPPLPVFCTEPTFRHLERAHWYGFHDGDTLAFHSLIPNQPLEHDPYCITPIPTDHFEGAVFFVIDFPPGTPPAHRLLIAWDITTPPAVLTALHRPSLALVDATTWSAMKDWTTHAGIEELVSSGFLAGLDLTYAPARQQYGAWLVHYSGLEDPWGILSDADLKARFDAAYPHLADIVRVAARGQVWQFE